jgi:hypothetical protein
VYSCARKSQHHVQEDNGLLKRHCRSCWEQINLLALVGENLGGKEAEVEGEWKRVQFLLMRVCFGIPLGGLRGLVDSEGFVPPELWG